ncbi:E3 ubiquitin-protein ligase Mdm2-like isoform X2 [Euwallacea fornicatus]|uniref:E3 ubiquitin-protein ligase Mdm2-like isoform X2 n=1 Tax=Euwallacea fornicatus TaxID=995702 RepID=UPI0033904FBC
MSTSLEHSNSGSPWRKRVHEDLMLDLKDFKKPRFNNYRLESESSKTSEEDTESVCSLQAKDTDFVKDTSDTESKSSSNSGDEYEVEVEYDVDSLSENDDIEISTTDSERMMLAAAAAAICDRSLEAWITDAEDSDSTSLEEPSVERSGFSTCVQCKGENLNPLYRYCEKCFQNCRQCNKEKKYQGFTLCQYCFKDRKKYFPPRPRRRRRKKPETSELSQESVKLDMLKYCLSGLSQDSGVSSNQDCPSLGLDRIVIPDHLQLPGTSKTEDNTPTISIPLENKTASFKTDLALKRKRQSSESSLSDLDTIKKPKREQHTSDLGSEISSTSSFTSAMLNIGGDTGETKGVGSNKPSPTPSLIGNSEGSVSERSESELCIFCNSAPKNSIFLHTNIAHRCCCYPCAKKTLKSTKRCPICNLSVNKVVRIFTS